MRNWRTVAEIVCVTVLLVWLAWVPLPFGSASDPALTPLVLPPLVIAGAACGLARGDRIRFTNHARWWIAGATAFVAVHALQLVPLPMPLLRLLSPNAARAWSEAARIAQLAGVPAGSWHPLSVDPSATLLQLFRVAAYAASFTAAMFLLRAKPRRMSLAVVLAAMAIFEAGYAIREAVLQRYAIWGWKNTLIHGRATGTFVNPNHFAHYAAIILPLALFLCAYAWHTAAAHGAPFGRRLVQMVERRFVPFAFGAVAALACVAAILVAQSRGATLAALGGLAAVGAMVGRRRAVARVALIAVCAATIFGGMFLLLRGTTYSEHFGDSGAGSLEGRRAAVVAALRVWQLFPLAGSGAGTYENVAQRFGEEGLRRLNHAHNDYLETLATTGLLGFLGAVIPLVAGAVALARAAFNNNGASWRRRAFYTAALTSLAIAMIHALIDFNFYIPANPATLAAIAGAAAGVRPRERT
jgi:O-Antigen ligase